MTSAMLGQLDMVVTPYAEVARIGRLNLLERQGPRPRGSHAPGFLLRWSKRFDWRMP